MAANAVLIWSTSLPIIIILRILRHQSATSWGVTAEQVSGKCTVRRTGPLERERWEPGSNRKMLLSGLITVYDDLSVHGDNVWLERNQALQDSVQIGLVCDIYPNCHTLLQKLCVMEAKILRRKKVQLWHVMIKPKSFLCNRFLSNCLRSILHSLWSLLQIQFRSHLYKVWHHNDSIASL